MRTNQTYTYEQIEAALAKGILRDSPSLAFEVNGVEQVIQNAHCTSEQLAAVPGFSEARWVYEGDTDEWIPCFHYAKDNEQPIDSIVDMEPHIDPYAERAGSFWVTPKGLPREQYYHIITEDGVSWIVDRYDGSNRYPLPTFDEEGKSEHFYIRKNNAGYCDKCKGQVPRRFQYRDPTEGNCRLYEVCLGCLEANRKADRAEFANDY